MSKQIIFTPLPPGNVIQFEYIIYSPLSTSQQANTAQSQLISSFGQSVKLTVNVVSMEQAPPPPPLQPPLPPPPPQQQQQLLLPQQGLAKHAIHLINGNIEYFTISCILLFIKKCIASLKSFSIIMPRQAMDV
jgi:hypothetical protein